MSYQLRLYPVMRNAPRRFKVQYLVPARPTNETLRLWLPTTQLTSSKSPGVDELHVQFKGEAKPVLLGADAVAPAFHGADTTWTFGLRLDYNQFVEMVYPSPISGSFFFSTFREDGESFYQLAVYPPESPSQRTPRRFVLLVDFNRFNTSGLDGELLLMMLKETMLQALSSQDSATLAVAFDEVEWGSNRLLPCDEASLDSLFEPVLKRAFPSYSYFQPLLEEAAQFAKKQNRQVEVVVLTNTDEINTNMGSKEAFADGITNMFPAGTTIHLVDLEDKSYLVYQNGRYETQLAGFYGRLCDQTGGNLFYLRYHDIKSILAALFYEQVNHFQEVEVQTRFAEGYAFGKHLIALHQGYYPLHFPVMEVGRFRGSLPLDITVLGKIRLDRVERRLTVLERDVVPGSRQLAAAWYGDHVRELLARTQTNATIQEIMDLSLNYNILTPYTGLLVFRPDQKGYDSSSLPSEGSSNGGSDGNYTGVQVVPVDPEPAFAAFPNPFNAQVSLRMVFPPGAGRGDFRISVYDLTGRKVVEFSVEPSGAEAVTVSWDGRGALGNALPSGIYLVVFQGPGFRKTVKLNL
ncbi:MAG TPA: T9SS type A sorting domain-containing protein, partial [bacterium]